MHEMQTILTDVRGVCLSVTRLKLAAARAMYATCRARGVFRCSLCQSTFTTCLAVQPLDCQIFVSSSNVNCTVLLDTNGRNLWILGILFVSRTPLFSPRLGLREVFALPSILIRRVESVVYYSVGVPSLLLLVYVARRERSVTSLDSKSFHILWVCECEIAYVAQCTRRPTAATCIGVGNVARTLSHVERSNWPGEVF